MSRQPMRAALALRQKRPKWHPWRRDNVVRFVVAITVFLVVAITVVRGIRAAEWVLLRQLPGAEWQQRGPVLDQETACRTALASDGFVVPTGTRLRCERVVPQKAAAR